MKIVSSIYNIQELNNNIKNMDCALLMIPNISLVYDDLDIELALNICNSNNVIPIIALNKIYQPYELDNIKNILSKYANGNVYFYISDIGVANIGIKMNIINKMIFNPETMITNTCDLIEYKNLGFDSLAMSHEITYKDLIKSYNESKADLFYLGFGHRLMFYSKRHLVSLYANKNNTEYPTKDLYLRESTREDFLPIIENNNGTMIYRSYLISLIDEMDNLSFLKYFYLDSLYIDDDIYSKVLELAYKLNNNEVTKSDAIEDLKSFNLDIQDGFKYKDSVYQKEELKS
ncbi:MAG: U32 family peptidase [Acholeplasmatales bacterium]|nr:U32 family peptidase [Acholeplasmatales bacterium]